MIIYYIQDSHLRNLRGNFLPKVEVSYPYKRRACEGVCQRCQDVALIWRLVFVIFKFLSQRSHSTCFVI